MDYLKPHRVSQDHSQDQQIPRSDETNQCPIGDVVRIGETRPISRLNAGRSLRLSSAARRDRHGQQTVSKQSRRQHRREGNHVNPLVGCARACVTVCRRCDRRVSKSRYAGRCGEEGRSGACGDRADGERVCPRDGSHIRFDDNAAGSLARKITRVAPHLWASCARVRERAFMKIISLAPEVL